MAEKKAAKKSTGTKAPAKKKFEPFRVRVIGGRLNVRKTPGLDAAVLKVLPEGTETLVIAVKKDWYQIGEGWIMAEFTEQM